MKRKYSLPPSMCSTKNHPKRLVWKRRESKKTFNFGTGNDRDSSSERLRFQLMRINFVVINQKWRSLFNFESLKKISEKEIPFGCGGEGVMVTWSHFRKQYPLTFRSNWTSYHFSCNSFPPHFSPTLWNWHSPDSLDIYQPVPCCVALM